jgi:hypothetical protein
MLVQPMHSQPHGSVDTVLPTLNFDPSWAHKVQPKVLSGLWKVAGPISPGSGGGATQIFWGIG